MSGPNAGPGQLQGVAAGAQDAASAAQGAPPAALPAPSGAAPQPQMSDAQILQELSKLDAPSAGAAPTGAQAPAQQAPQMSDQEILQALDGMNAPGAAPAQPSIGERALDALGQISPLVGLMRAGKGSNKEAPPLAEILSKVGKTPEAQRQVFANWAGKDFDTRVSGGEVEFKRKGESDWRAITPEMKTPTSVVERVMGFWPDLAEGLIQSGSTVAGAAAGAAAGLPAAGVGAVPGGVAGGMAAGAAGGAAAALARESAARMLGADPSASLGTDVGIQSALGAAAPLLGAAIQRPAQWAAKKLIEAADKSSIVGAQQVGSLVKEFHDMFLATADKSLSQYDAGKQASSALSQAEARLGERVGMVKSAVEGKAGDQIFATPNFTQGLENTLQDRGFRMIEKPRLMPGEPVQYELRKPSGALAALREGSHPELKGLEDTLAQVWNQQRSSGGGHTVSDLFDTLKLVQNRANFGSEDPSAVEQTYRALYGSLRQDRNDILGNLAKGTEVEGIAKSAFSDYANKIDDLRMLSRAAEKSPEKFASWIFRDADTAKLAKSVLSNPDHVGTENLMGWDALKSSWIMKHLGDTQDAKTGIVDLTKMAANMGKNPEIAKTVLGEGGLEEMKRLGTSLDRVTWKGLLANPDSESSGGVFRALSKAFISKMHPAYAANALGAIVNYDPAILKQIQSQGIMKFAEEAPTLQAKNKMLRLGNMIQKLSDYGAATLPIGQSQTMRIPIARSIIPVLLNGGVRPADESPMAQHTQQSYAAQMFQEHQAEQARDLERQMHARALQQQAQPASAGLPALFNVGPGQAPQRFPMPNIFAGRGRSMLHLKR